MMTVEKCTGKSTNAQLSLSFRPATYVQQNPKTTKKATHLLSFRKKNTTVENPDAECNFAQRHPAKKKTLKVPEDSTEEGDPGGCFASQVLQNHRRPRPERHSRETTERGLRKIRVRTVSALYGIVSFRTLWVPAPSRVHCNTTSTPCRLQHMGTVPPLSHPCEGDLTVTLEGSNVEAVALKSGSDTDDGQGGGDQNRTARVNEPQFPASPPPPVRRHSHPCHTHRFQGQGCSYSDVPSHLDQARWDWAPGLPAGSKVCQNLSDATFIKDQGKQSTFASHSDRHQTSPRAFTQDTEFVRNQITPSVQAFEQDKDSVRKQTVADRILLKDQTHEKLLNFKSQPSYAGHTARRCAPNESSSVCPDQVTPQPTLHTQNRSETERDERESMGVSPPDARKASEAKTRPGRDTVMRKGRLKKQQLLKTGPGLSVLSASTERTAAHSAEGQRCTGRKLDHKCRVSVKRATSTTYNSPEEIPMNSVECEGQELMQGGDNNEPETLFLLSMSLEISDVAKSRAFVQNIDNIVVQDSINLVLQNSDNITVPQNNDFTTKTDIHARSLPSESSKTSAHEIHKAEASAGHRGATNSVVGADKTAVCLQSGSSQSSAVHTLQSEASTTTETIHSCSMTTEGETHCLQSESSTQAAVDSLCGQTLTGTTVVHDQVRKTEGEGSPTLSDSPERPDDTRSLEAETFLAETGANDCTSGTETHALETETHALETETRTSETETRSLGPKTCSSETENHSETDSLETETRSSREETCSLGTEVHYLDTDSCSLGKGTCSSETETCSLGTGAHSSPSETSQKGYATHQETEDPPLMTYTYTHCGREGPAERPADWRLSQLSYSPVTKCGGSWPRQTVDENHGNGSSTIQTAAAAASFSWQCVVSSGRIPTQTSENDQCPVSSKNSHNSVVNAERRAVSAPFPFSSEGSQESPPTETREPVSADVCSRSESSKASAVEKGVMVLPTAVTHTPISSERGDDASLAFKPNTPATVLDQTHTVGGGFQISAKDPGQARSSDQTDTSSDPRPRLTTPVDWYYSGEDSEVISGKGAAPCRSAVTVSDISLCHFNHPGSGDDDTPSDDVNEGSDITSEVSWHSLGMELWRENVIAATSFGKRARKQREQKRCRQTSAPAGIHISGLENMRTLSEVLRDLVLCCQGDTAAL